MAGMLAKFVRGAAAAGADHWGKKADDQLEMIRRRRLKEMDIEFSDAEYEKTQQRKRAELDDPNSLFNRERQMELELYEDKKKVDEKYSTKSETNDQIKDVLTGETDGLGNPIKKTFIKVAGKWVPFNSQITAAGDTPGAAGDTPGAADDAVSTDPRMEALEAARAARLGGKKDDGTIPEVKPMDVDGEVVPKSAPTPKTDTTEKPKNSTNYTDPEQSTKALQTAQARGEEARQKQYTVLLTELEEKAASMSASELRKWYNGEFKERIPFGGLANIFSPDPVEKRYREILASKKGQ